jgi:nucleoside-diphosphate-sugar epimerase
LIEWCEQQKIKTASATSKVAFPPSITKFPHGKIVVTGGTGFVGGGLLERLTQLGASNLFVAVRSFRTGANAGRFPIRFEHADLLNPKSLRRLVQGARTVFHLAYGSDGPDATRITTEGAVNLCAACIEENVESVIVVSTTAVYGHAVTDHLVDETWSYRRDGNEYEAAKIKMEKRVLELARTAGNTRIVIVQPACIYGPRGGAFTELPIRMASDGTFAWVDRGIGTANFTYIDNFVEALLLAANCSAAHGERFIICDGAVSWRDFLTPLLGSLAELVPSYTVEELQQLNAQQPAPRVIDFVRALLRNDEFLHLANCSPLLAGGRKLLESLLPSQMRKLHELCETQTNKIAITPTVSRTPPLWLARMYGPFHTQFSSAKAERLLHWRPRTTLEEGQARCVDWLRYVRLLPTDDYL